METLNFEELESSIDGVDSGATSQADHRRERAEMFRRLTSNRGRLPGVEFEASAAEQIDQPQQIHQERSE